MCRNSFSFEMTGIQTKSVAGPFGLLGIKYTYIGRLGGK